MKATGTILTYSGNKTIKAFSGTLGDSLLRLPATLDQVKIGELKFVTRNTNLLSGATNREMKVLEGAVLVSIEGFWHTLNTVTVKVLANTAQDQQAFFTIQHGAQSQVALNAQESYVTFLHIPGVPLIVTASNFSTGATQFTQVTPVAGQLYSLTSVSQSVQTGELKTVGGEQFGELKTVCTLEGYDIAGAPIAYSGITSTTLIPNSGSASAGIVISPSSKFIVDKFYENEADAKEDFDAFYWQVLSNRTDPNLPYQGRLLCAEIIQSPLMLVNGTTRQDLLIGEPMKLTTVGTYSIVREHPTKGDYTVLQFVSSAANDVAVFYVSSRLVDNPVLSVAQLYITTDANGVSVTQYRSQVGEELQITNEVFIKNPVTKICLSQQQIDTRYTTPVITTDTRRTDHSITITLTPLN